MVKVLGIGDNLCDVYLHTKTMYPGGQALNVAVFSGMLRAKADFMGAFGSDAVAAHVKSTLDRLGVGRSRCREYEGENGFARVILENGDRVFRGSNRGGVLREHPIELDEDDLEYMKAFDVVHTSNNSYFDPQLSLLAKLGTRVSYDFSYRWNEPDRVERVCPYIDFGFLSCGGVTAGEAEKICASIYGAGCKTVVATMGGRGALLFDGVNMLYNQPELIEAVDTMGAGDSFAACVLVGAAQAIGENPERWGNAAFRKDCYGRIMARAAAFAARTCMTNGSFGYGTPLPDSVAGRVLNWTEG